jgi:hypothetical protein
VTARRGGGAGNTPGTSAGPWAKVWQAAWPLFQATAAATAAWAIASRFAGHPDPFFAPVAAVVALNAPRGERGLQAVRLLLGVVLGILVGELTVALVGGGAGWLAPASFVAMAAAHAAGGARIVVIQAGVGAILTVLAAGGQAGVHRLIDALIGGSVALLFSQVLFSPEPVSLLRRAEADALAGIAHGLDLTADALESDDVAVADQALATLRDLRDRLAELARLRTASGNVARHSAIWRSQRGPLVRERENADQLDLLAGGCVMLARTAFAIEPPERRALAPGVRDLASVLAALAQAPGDRDIRQRAADRALEASRDLAAGGAPSDPAVAVVHAVLRIVATDVMVFAGADAAQAAAAMLAAGELRVPDPPQAPRVPFGLDRWGGARRVRGSSRELPRREADAPDDDPEQ